MAWTTSEQQRITALEEVINDLQVAISNLMSKQQFSQLLILKQAEIDALTTRVTSLETQVAVLQGTIS